MTIYSIPGAVSMAREAVKSLSPSVKKAPTQDEMREASESLFRKTNQFLETPNPLPIELLHAIHAAIPDPAAEALLLTPEGQLQFVTMYRWAKEAYPQIELGHKFLAALLTTAVPKDLLDMVVPPWRCFCITLPDMIQVFNPECGADPVRRLYVLYEDDAPEGRHWSYWCLSANGITSWRYGMTTQNLIPQKGDEMWLDKDPLLLEQTDLDERAYQLFGTLIINLCLAMTNAENVKKAGPGHKVWDKAKSEGRRPGEPTTRLFQVGSPVKHDFRACVADYMAGNGNKLTVQSRVCGHYKAQPFGPKLASRKVIWVQPYWRGPEDAPIIVRPHKVK